MQKHPKAPIISLLLVSGLLTGFAKSPKDYFSDWPEDSQPAAIGETVAKVWMETPFLFEERPEFDEVRYYEICTWYGSLQVTRNIGNKDLQKQLIDRFDRFLGEDKKYLSRTRHVDHSITGVIPMEIYLINGDESLKKLGLSFADRQWEHPDEQGLSAESRFWIDDLYMLPILQVQAYRVTGDEIYLNRAARTVVAYLEDLQQPNGLFLHAADSPFYWGRGNGWAAAGIAELLRELPKSNAHYEVVVDGYREMMESLAEYQTESGLWRQLIDDPNCWEETSSTGMFTFAMIIGVKIGVLDADRFGPVARKGWLALVDQIDDTGRVQNVCGGTNKGSMVVGSDLDKQKEFYYARPRRTGDWHGQAPILWCAAALMR